MLNLLAILDNTNITMKMKTLSKLLLTGTILTITGGKMLAQDNSPVLMTIAGKDVTKTEFENIYHKNSPKDKVSDPKSLKEYLELFINFKLKVKEAEELGLDTNASFKNELEGYRKQLAQPYLNDNEVTEALIKEAYDRMGYDIRASHILIKCDPNALPKDTIIAYNKTLDLRKRILKGESFETLAKQISDDPSAKENGGDLGYFTALQMVYPFESAVYTTKVGDVSMPVRTRFGYHIIKVADKRAAQGQILVQHIMVKAPKGVSKEDSVKARDKIFELYNKVKKNEDFVELAKQYSDDKSSAKKGGELPWFGSGKMVYEFEKAAFALANNGDYSEPVLTQFGWHIIKRIDKKPLPKFDELKSELKSKIAKDSRAQKSKESLIARVKKENGFKENLKVRDEFVKVIDTTYFEGKWSADKAASLNKELFNIGSKKYTQTDFAKFLSSRQTKTKKMDITMLVNNMYKEFVNQACVDFEESKLADKYQDFRLLMNEYRDGILLFELTDRKVWSAAVKDSMGLKEFYEQNKSNYLWEDRLDATIYKCNSRETADKVNKMLANKKKKYTTDEIQKEINKDSQLNLQVESGKYLKGDNDMLDKLEWNPGTTKEVVNDKQVTIVVMNKILTKEPKTLNEAKGLVTADYQNFLEKKWIESLRAKYTVKVNEDVLQTIK